MPKRFQRLILIALSLVFILIATILVLTNVKNNIVFFLTPSEIMNMEIVNKKKIRIGGFVKSNSLLIQADTNLINFLITDNDKEIKVFYSGILPDLFKEGGGVVAEGALNNGILNAKKIYAKHDENYVPAEIKDQLKEKQYWKKDYK